MNEKEKLIADLMAEIKDFTREQLDLFLEYLNKLEKSSTESRGSEDE